jgi:hypothetical protein
MQALRLDACRLDFQSQEHAARSITDTALSWGYNSPAHFSRVFRKQFGATPSEWRARVAGRGVIFAACASCVALMTGYSLEKEIRDHRAQPPVGGIVLVSLVPMLLDRKGRQLEGRCERLHLGNAHEHLRYSLRHGCD